VVIGWVSAEVLNFSFEKQDNEMDIAIIFVMCIELSTPLLGRSCLLAGD